MPDERDPCPLEAGALPNGCPVRDSDSDGTNDSQDQDGFLDHADKCRAVPGVAIRPSSEMALAKAASVLQEGPSLRVEVIGHSDDRGSRELNLDLSLRRAEAVKQSLVARGIDVSRIQSRGAGPDEPLTSNDSPAGRQKNRRIEVRIIQ